MRRKPTIVVKTMKPGDPGTRRQLERWGADLLCVRYRYDDERRERLTTVEIVIERAARAPRVDPDHQVGVRLRYEETELRHRVREAGGQWDPRRKLWWMTWAGALRIGVAERVAAWSDSATG